MVINPNNPKVDYFFKKCKKVFFKNANTGFDWNSSYNTFKTPFSSVNVFLFRILVSKLNFKDTNF